MTETEKQKTACKRIGALLLNYNLQMFIPEVEEAMEEGTWEAYRILLLELEGKVEGSKTVLNLLIERRGESEAQQIISELREIMDEAS